MRTVSHKLPVSVIVAFTALLSIVQFVHAECVQWNTMTFAGYTADQYLYACDTPLLQRLLYPHPCIAVLSNPNVSVTYNVRATNAATGANVCNTTVPAGTKINFTFVPHQYTDVSWFGAGLNYDSPYGDWSADASSPPPDQQFLWCADKNYFFMLGSRKQY